MFGDLNAFAGSGNDIFALAEKKADASFLFAFEEGFARAAESERLAEALGGAAKTLVFPARADLGSCQATLRAAAAWMMEAQA